jgi:hypothetical protein
MFTIKHVSPSGNEALLMAREVSYTPADPNIGTTGRVAPSTGTVFYKPDAALPEFLSVKDGLVFVMNGNGATVSKWDLGGWDTIGSVPAKPI